MQVSEDATRMIERRTSAILKGIDVPESVKSEIKRELISNYVEASTEKARARGAASVEKDDVAAAFETSSDPDEMAPMYMAQYVKSIKRAGLPSRMIAFVVDTVITTIVTLVIASPIIFLRVYSSEVLDWNNLHVKFVLEYFYLIIYLNLIVVFVYFVVYEGFTGHTPGKRLLGLKVLKADGDKPDYREAMLRTIPKLFIIAIVADAILMLLYKGKDKQRIFDRIARTIVIKK